MTTFPVATSTLSEKGLNTFIKEKYGLNNNYTCSLFRTGINHTYFISDNTTKYVLRVYCVDWRTKLEIEEELNLLRLLKKNGLSISYPISDKNGNAIQPINAPEGKRYAVLFSFAEGKKIRFISEDNCVAIGSIMASIHAVTEGSKIKRIKYTEETLVKLPYNYTKEHFSESLEEMQFLKKTQKTIIKSFSDVDLPSIKKGIVHLDIWYDNMNITDADKITLFDFDFCGNGWLILDVAYFCKQLFHIETDKNTYELKVKRFLEGYQTTRKLSDSELKLIPLAGAAIWMFYLGIQSQRFDWSNVFLTENFLKMYVGSMKSWMTYHNLLN